LKLKLENMTENGKMLNIRHLHNFKIKNNFNKFSQHAQSFRLFLSFSQKNTILMLFGDDSDFCLAGLINPNFNLFSWFRLLDWPIRIAIHFLGLDCVWQSSFIINLDLDSQFNNSIETKITENFFKKMYCRIGILQLGWT